MKQLWWTLILTRLNLVHTRQHCFFHEIQFVPQNNVWSTKYCFIYKILFGLQNTVWPTKYSLSHEMKFAPKRYSLCYKRQVAGTSFYYLCYFCFFFYCYNHQFYKAVLLCNIYVNLCSNNIVVGVKMCKSVSLRILPGGTSSCLKFNMKFMLKFIDLEMLIVSFIIFIYSIDVFYLYIFYIFISYSFFIFHIYFIYFIFIYTFNLFNFHAWSI